MKKRYDQRYYHKYHDNYDGDDHLMIKKEEEWYEYDYQERRRMIRCFLLWSDDVRGQVSCVLYREITDKSVKLTES